MANKIITFGNSLDRYNTSTQNNVAYKDISMISQFLYQRCPNISDEKYKLFSMLAEERENSYDLHDPVLTEKERKLIRLYSGIDYEQYEYDYKLYLKLGHYGIDDYINVQAITNSLRNIFTWRPGERILNPEFGSRLYMLLYEGITPETEERIMAEIRHCVSEWEPRVSITEVRDISTIEETEDNTIHLEVIFVIPSLSDEQYSYSFKYNRSES